jgi:hypothetical protein
MSYEANDVEFWDNISLDGSRSSELPDAALGDWNVCGNMDNNENETTLDE